jgi:anaerobic selenocysteine-containing dehydrogenase
MAMRTIACLPALVGAFNKHGAGITRSVGGGPKEPYPLDPAGSLPQGTRVVNMVELGDALIQLDAPPIKLLYNFMSNPAAVAPQSALVHEGLKREDLFLVVHELFMTDTALFADIILPGASFFEMTDIYEAYGHNYLRLATCHPPCGPKPAQPGHFPGIGQAHGVCRKRSSAWARKNLIKGFFAGRPSLACKGSIMMPFGRRRRCA